MYFPICAYMPLVVIGIIGENQKRSGCTCKIGKVVQQLLEPLQFSEKPNWITQILLIVYYYKCHNDIILVPLITALSPKKVDPLNT